jgi:RNA polymerase sigma factor (sigma-70 family)
VAQAAGRWQYDPNQGTFRSWLYAITRNKISQHFRRRHLQPAGSGDSGALQMLNEQPGPEPDNDAAWEQEYRQQIFQLAAEQVRNDFAPNTWQAFWQTAVEGKCAPDVAATLGLSVGAVYVAKSRVLARLTEQVQQLQSE